MRTIFLSLATLAFACGGGAGHADDRAAQPGIYGIMRSDGTFRPVQRFVSASAASALTASTSTFYGSIVGNIALGISSDSNRLNPATIKCTIRALVIENTPDGSYREETSTVAATISGNRALCHPKIIYQWNLYTPAEDAITIQLSISGLDANGLGRESRPAPDMTVALPPSGATSNFDFSGRI